MALASYKEIQTGMPAILGSLYHNIPIHQHFKMYYMHSVFQALDKFCPYVAVAPLKYSESNKLL